MTSSRAFALVSLCVGTLACPASDDTADDTSVATTAPTTAADTAANEDTMTSVDETGPMASGDDGGGELTWGAPCSADADCVALIGDGAICAGEAVIYELPGGYCTKPCNLPDPMTTVVADSPDCDPAGGVDCIGSMGFLETCAVPCGSTADCGGRENYECRQMPMIAQPDDPTYCLMPDCCQADCTDC
jgi:hypothetical protein